MKNKIAIVLTGGGARACYQAGVIRALYEILKKDINLFDIITGNSAGAINAIFLANNAHSWKNSTKKLLEFWSRIKPEDIFDISNYTMTNMSARWFKGTIFKETLAGTPYNAILNTNPLHKLLSREINFSNLHQLINDKKIHAVALSATNYYSDSSVVFYDGDESIKEWSKVDRLSIRTNLGVEHVMGSSAIPFFFPPIKINNSFYGDGCIRQITPLSPAIHLGATKIVAIGVKKSRSIDEIKKMTLETNLPPPITQVGGIVMNAIFLDSLETDVQRLERMNAISTLIGTNSPIKNIPILALNPSEDIGVLSKKLLHKIPTILRYFLKQSGINTESGLDVLSYLAFDSSYTTKVVELGYEDTMARKNQIINFIKA